MVKIVSWSERCHDQERCMESVCNFKRMASVPVMHVYQSRLSCVAVTNSPSVEIASANKGLFPFRPACPLHHSLSGTQAVEAAVLWQHHLGDVAAVRQESLAWLFAVSAPGSSITYPYWTDWTIWPLLSAEGLLGDVGEQMDCYLCCRLILVMWVKMSDRSRWVLP